MAYVATDFTASIASISTVEKAQLAQRWLPKEQIEQRYNSALKLALLLTLLVVVLLWIVWVFIQKNKAIAKAKEKADQAILELELLKKSLEQQVIERTKKLLVLSYQDKVTKLDNRNAFYEKGKQLFKNHIQQQQSMVLLVININRFKNINESFGHQVGNDVLKKIAKRLLNLTSSNDLVVRYGGDEFGVLLSDTNAEQAIVIAKQLLTRLQQPYLVAREPFSLSFSIGLAQIPEDAATLEQLYQHAEIAMFKAKQNGTSIEQYQVSASKEISNYIQLEQNLLKVIRVIQHNEQQEQLSLRFQPIKYVNKAGLNSFEVLIRWQHQRLGFVAPDVFIPLAEQLNKIKHIGHWVRVSALKQAKNWHQQGVAFNRLSINISAVELQQADFVTQLKTEVMSLQADFNWIELEVTETAILKDPEHAISMLTQCKALGMTISIDDFGTGYSSLVYLKRIPADVVKIDREFVKNLPESREDAAIDQSIIQLCHSFNKLVIAEGVETREQYQLLKSFGVDCIQGYIVAKPLTAEQILPELPFFAQTTDNLL